MRGIGTPLAACVLALAGAGSAFAQSPAPAVRTDIEVTRADIQADRKTIVADNLPLSETQAAAFWPLYREYRAEMDKIGDRMVNALTEYAKSYQSLTDAQAGKLVNDWLAIQKDIPGVRAKYLPKFSAVLPMKLVARFYQIENKLDTIVMMDLVIGVPLVK